MSSPLSTLKKFKRTPLWPRENSDIHHRRNLLKDFQVAAADSSSISDETSKPLDNTNFPQLKNDSALSRSDKMSPVMQKLCSLEERVVAQAEEIRYKDKRISALEEDLRINKKIFERRCTKLQQQVFEMENFLKDYNMIWVGESTDAEESRPTYCSSRLWTPPENSDDEQFCINFDLILDKIQELNSVAGEGETYIQATVTGAQLAQNKPIELWLYKNGILVSDDPFRTYQEQKTQQFMQDLMDGYFPSELQEGFPDGVPFEVHDRRDELFIPKLQRQTFPGCGHIIGAGNGKSPSLPNAVPDSGEILSRWQRTTIREVSKKLASSEQGSSSAYSSNSVILIDTPAQQAMKSFQVNSECPDDMTTLKIRSEDGSCIFILKMSFSETIGHIRQYLEKHRGGDPQSYGIISLYPPRCYNDNSQTIRACGLTANTALLLRTRPAGNIQ